MPVISKYENNFHLVECSLWPYCVHRARERESIHKRSLTLAQHALHFAATQQYELKCMNVFLFAYTLENCHMSSTMTRLKVIVCICRLWLPYPYRSPMFARLKITLVDWPVCKRKLCTTPMYRQWTWWFFDMNFFRLCEIKNNDSMKFQFGKCEKRKVKWAQHTAPKSIRFCCPG